MVFVNGQKFACEACIKGHRSSGCHHADRALFKIQKKGRPSTQCDKCRQERKARNYHGRCNCSEDSTLNVSSSKPARTLKDSRPAYPNGLKDVLNASSETHCAPTHPKQRVDMLLNPCGCRDPYSRCHCPSPDTNGRKDSSLHVIGAIAEIETAKSKAHSVVVSHRIELAPIIDSPETQTQHLTSKLPSCVDTTVFPRFIERDRCGCGTQCACPGCKEHHRTPISSGEQDCPDRCASCVDRATENALPSSAAAHYAGSLDRFLALAESLPAPPNQFRPFDLQQLSQSVVIYPSAVFHCENARAVAQLVRIPPLECCGGKCQCPANHCTCTESCEGCCAEDEHLADSQPPPMMDHPKTSCCQPAAS